MSNAAADLKTVLAANSALTAIVGDRIYHRHLPDLEALPAIVCNRSNTTYVNTIHGPAKASDVTFDLMCGASSNDVADDIADVLEVVPGIQVINRVDDYDFETKISASIVTVILMNQVP